ncbi:hypothetical protein KIW84_035152 [Lathyrus oleraceus]|uniref:Uncharacterized protein n=1 Tax=Pisum sativum TaxID=3888 RepID=A0A9D4Y217_PEA|nr:hypothetical protein KIW84_035152 [Pisum sativum]
MNCKEDALSKVLFDTGLSLNMLPKSTLSKLSYQGAPMRYNRVIVKAFDGSCKTVTGDVDLPVEYEDKVGTPFQALSIAAEKRVRAHMTSLKDARKIVEEGNVDELIPNPIKYNDSSPSPNCEFHVFEAVEESDVEVSDELSRLLVQDEKTIQPFEEQIELVKLGSEDDVKEVKIGVN